MALEARAIRVYEIEMMRYEWPFVQIRVNCGRGTYIRSLARDIGEELGTQGYLTELKRTAVGRFRIEDAATIERVQAEGVESFLKQL